VPANNQHNAPAPYKNWVIDVLPYAEGKTIVQSMNLKLPISDPANEVGRATPLELMRCPSDPNNLIPFDPTQNSQTKVFGVKIWARGNYAANASLGFMVNGTGSNNAGNPNIWHGKFEAGVMGANTALRVTDIHDGASKTILLAEVRAGIVPFDCRGTWAMSGSPTSLWACGWDGDDNGPNYSAINANYTNNLGYADDCEACSAIEAKVGGAIPLAKMGMSCSQDDWPNWQGTARSMHRDGVNACLADGSTLFISDFIQTGTSQQNLGVWDKLLLSNDGEPIRTGSY
jgi:hypothetical protein